MFEFITFCGRKERIFPIRSQKVILGCSEFKLQTLYGLNLGGAGLWELLELEGIERMPAVQWKLINISRTDKKKHMAVLRKLEKCLSR
jgi:hypothetical protein